MFTNGKEKKNIKDHSGILAMDKVTIKMNYMSKLQTKIIMQTDQKIMGLKLIRFIMVKYIHIENVLSTDKNV